MYSLNREELLRPLRPLFGRHSVAEDLERAAERLKNRDWVEILRVVHPSQAEAAEREYIIARLRHDWPELTSPLLATHSLLDTLKARTLVVRCDHNTFANELSLIAPAVEKKITARYGITVKIAAQASRRIDWGKTKIAETEIPATEALKPRSPENPVLEKLIGEISRLE